jgi:hypothetical protein
VGWPAARAPIDQSIDTSSRSPTPQHTHTHTQTFPRKLTHTRTHHNTNTNNSLPPPPPPPPTHTTTTHPQQHKHHRCPTPHTVVLEVVMEGQVVLDVRVQQHRRLVRPAPGHVAKRVPPTAQHEDLHVLCVVVGWLVRVRGEKEEEGWDRKVASFFFFVVVNPDLIHTNAPGTVEERHIHYMYYIYMYIRETHI